MKDGTETTDAVAIAERQVAPIVQTAQALVIVTPDDYERAANGLQVIKGQAKRIDAELIEPWRQQKRHADGEMKRLTDMLVTPLKQAETILKDKQIAWTREQERIRVAEQARLQAEADARAEAERKKLEKEAAKLKTPELREQRLEQAAAVVAAPIILAPAVPTIKGQSYSTRWKARVIDETAAIKALAQLLDAPCYLSINQGPLDSLANRTKGKQPLLGIEWYEHTTLASASK